LTQALHSRFVQPGWQVGGNVYQAGEMHITIGQSWLRTWHVWAALLLLLAVLALALDVPDKVHTLWGGERLVQQTLAGVIWDEHRQGLAGVEVFVPELNLTTPTDARGYFSMQVRATPQRSVELIASKSGYETRKIEATLGNSNVQFIMRHP
jgi:carboxypeptidase-like protein